MSVPFDPPGRPGFPLRAWASYGGRHGVPVSGTGEGSSWGSRWREPRLRAPDRPSVRRVSSGSPGPSGRGVDDGEGGPETPSVVAVKVLVAGGRGVGKTAFVGAISDIDPLTVEVVAAEGGAGEPEVDATIGVDVGRVGLDDEIVLYLFGMPERENRELLREEFADGAAGAVVLVDLRCVDRCYPAIDLFEECGVPFAVAVNDFGGADRFGLDEVRDALGVGAGVPLVRCDARDRDSVKQVMIALVEDAFNDR